MTVGTELDKLAANLAIGWCLGGARWRTDVVRGLRLGKAVALEVLRERSIVGPR
jgi:hypothetical protein